MRLHGSLPAAITTACAVAIAASVVSRAMAITFLDTAYGTPQGSAIGRSAAMGATGVALAHGSQSLIHNPALLAVGDYHVHEQFQIGVTYAAEDRLVPLFDSFDSFVRETTISTNRNTYAQAEGGLVLHLPTSVPMAIAAGLFERYDFDFNYFEEVRNPTPFPGASRDIIVGERTWDVEGVLRSVSAGYAAELAGPIQFGFSAHHYFGKVRSMRRETMFLLETSTAERLERDLVGWGFSVGGHGAIGEHVALGVAYEAPFTVSGTYVASDATGSSLNEEEIKYPGTLSFGVTYQPRNVLSTLFTAEALFRNWQDLEDTFRTIVPDNRFVLRDTWDLRVGVEHIFYNGLPVRFGFRYLQNYADSESERTIYSVGTGYVVDHFRFDVTGVYHRQTSRQGFLFDPSVTGFPAPDGDTKVEDSVMQLVLAVSRNF